MYYGCRRSVFILILLSTFGAFSEGGSNFTAPVPSPGSPGFYLDDRCTLLTFKKRLFNEGGSKLRSWRSSTNVTLWKGVSWKAAGDGTFYVVRLDLGDFQLNGTTIAPLLQEGLTNLTVLNISANFLEGNLPDPLRICPSLLALDLSHNSFSGNLLRNFNCADMPLNPATFDSINLQVLDDLRNKANFSEGPSFPSFNGKLMEFKLSYNKFSGTFPFDALGKLEKLETVDATSNYITGNLEIGMDEGSFGQLKSLSLGYNQLSGGIPESLGNLSRLEVLELKFNNLTGWIPRTLAKLANLKILRLQGNNLNGTIPEEFSQLSNLATLSLNRNKLRGSLSHLSNCTNLKNVWLSQNSLSGDIPPELGNLTNLVVLSLSGNLFNGSIPQELGHLRTLLALDLGWNSLRGNIPGGLCDLFQLHLFLLNNNRLTGSIPNCFGNYTYLRLVDFSANFLSGSFPDDLNNLSVNLHGKAPDDLSLATIQELAGQNLVYGFGASPVSYSFTNNFLSGQIPAAFGVIRNLQQLRLSNNNLSGPIPEALGNLSSLYWLDLSCNYLSGRILYNLSDLYSLSFLNLSYNLLWGPIPHVYQFSTFGESSFVGNPGLCGFPLLDPCGSVPQRPEHGPPPSSHESFIEDWVSFRAFGVGVTISFTLLSCFLLPVAYVSGKRSRLRELCRNVQTHMAFSGTLNKDVPELYYMSESLFVKSLNEEDLHNVDPLWNSRQKLRNWFESDGFPSG